MSKYEQFHSVNYNKDVIKISMLNAMLLEQDLRPYVSMQNSPVL